MSHAEEEAKAGGASSFTKEDGNLYVAFPIFKY
jgi:hypothetical protein